ncbi:tRNA (guanosine(37)-N1)-methyltransferase TrmD [Rhodoluna sp. KAS3]|uniref:tRNA (guanosine(37)-N1)-methyltransferase TrmD n=1 Tax=Rhodoluna sp. KAS3 TaxID=942880 RepID=UPI0022314933|nr:tRNA (guanosine(37)-N1)-methyltransferase TrmD [Rhodoluna sp. KAS3]BDS49259.1 tRNA (guanine-N(1)-)-methyltransferase [Rhodoluna sp. KAS3]
MRIDAVTIFPDYFNALDLSLLGKAREKNLIEFTAHDLRDYTHDKHRTVDDSPYGGGAGMLMKPEPWGEALDAILPADGDCTVIFTSPAGEQFKQATAYELAKEKQIVFACGRYEGIDQRVVDYAATKAKVRLISLGDYVLNGGEVAAIAMTEAIVRLIPGVIGNAESLIEESHSDGLLEYPSYTKPASWRGFDVPEVLTSGNHAAIAAWRREQQIERTRRVRPDLLDK